jgi:phospholipid N-methyltransferase
MVLLGFLMFTLSAEGASPKVEVVKYPVTKAGTTKTYKVAILMINTLSKPLVENPKTAQLESYSAEKLGDYMRQLEINEVDYVVSAIPFVALSDELSYAIVQGCFTALKKKGLYIQFHYSTLIKKMYKKIFGNIDINFVALNIPPAFVMICEKN